MALARSARTVGVSTLPGSFTRDRAKFCAAAYDEALVEALLDLRLGRRFALLRDDASARARSGPCVRCGRCPSPARRSPRLPISAREVSAHGRFSRCSSESAWSSGNAIATSRMARGLAARTAAPAPLRTSSTESVLALPSPTISRRSAFSPPGACSSSVSHSACLELARAHELVGRIGHGVRSGQQYRDRLRRLCRWQYRPQRRPASPWRTPPHPETEPWYPCPYPNRARLACKRRTAQPTVYQAKLQSHVEHSRRTRNRWTLLTAQAAYRRWLRAIAALASLSASRFFRSRACPIPACLWRARSRTSRGRCGSRAAPGSA